MTSSYERSLKKHVQQWVQKEYGINAMPEGHHQQSSRHHRHQAVRKPVGRKYIGGVCKIMQQVLSSSQ